MINSIQDYQRESAKTASIRDISLDEEFSRVLHGAIGAATEAGELLDNLKKRLWYNKPVDEENLQEEIGDILWYLAEICNAKGWCLMDLAEKNYRKLQNKRYKSGSFTPEESLNRNVDEEMKVFEEGGWISSDDTILQDSVLASRGDFERQLKNTMGDSSEAEIDPLKTHYDVVMPAKYSAVPPGVDKIKAAVAERTVDEPWPNAYTGKQ